MSIRSQLLPSHVIRPVGKPWCCPLWSISGDTSRPMDEDGDDASSSSTCASHSDKDGWDVEFPSNCWECGRYWKWPAGLDEHAVCQSCRDQRSCAIGRHWIRFVESLLRGSGPGIRDSRASVELIISASAPARASTDVGGDGGSL